MTEVKRVYIDDHQASKFIGYKVNTLRMWRHKGIGPPYYKIHGAARYTIIDLVAWMERHRIEPWMYEVEKKKLKG